RISIRSPRVSAWVMLSKTALPSPRRRGARSAGRASAPRRSGRAWSCSGSLGKRPSVEEEEAAQRLARRGQERLAEELDEPGQAAQTHAPHTRLARLLRLLPRLARRGLEPAQLIDQAGGQRLGARV